MTYVFDTNALITLFNSYYRTRFPSLWVQFDGLINTGKVVSTREVLREIEGTSIESLEAWCKANKAVFTVPTAAEGAFVAQIFQVTHFQQNIEQKKLIKGGKNADPFVIAKAKIANGAVVTLEQARPNSVKIPTICEHFGVACMSLEAFMEAESWKF